MRQPSHFFTLVSLTISLVPYSVYAELGIQEGEAHIVRNAGGVA